MSVETTYTNLRQNLSSVLDQEVVIVRRRNGRDVALIPADELESILETAHLLHSPANAKRLARALHRADAHKTPASTADELMHGWRRRGLLAAESLVSQCRHGADSRCPPGGKVSSERRCCGQRHSGHAHQNRVVRLYVKKYSGDHAGYGKDTWQSQRQSRRNQRQRLPEDHPEQPGFRGPQWNRRNCFPARLTF
jgi:antitoxin YefM